MNLEYKRIHSQLPIYKIYYKKSFFLYSEGFYNEVRSEKEVKNFQNKIGNINKFTYEEEKILELAQNSYNKWKYIHSAQFNPACLTVIPNYDCNLICEYCFNENDRNNKSQINIESVKKYAETIISKCSKSDRQFVLVLAGGGEPTLHWNLLKNIVIETAKIAVKYGVNKFSYISTNGTLLDDEKTEWLVENFDLIGLSCDGPPNIDNKKTQQSVSSFYQIIKIGSLITKYNGQFDVRVTVKNDNFLDQKEIVKQITENMRCRTIRIEPVYGGDKNLEDSEKNSTLFVQGFTEAKEFAHKQNVVVSYSGLRLKDVHSTYCDIFRDTIRLFPDGKNRLCFLNKSENKFELKLNEIIEYKKQLLAEQYFHEENMFEKCQTCIVEFHCTRGCPDYCFIDNKKTRSKEFRCLVNQKLAEKHIIRNLERLFFNEKYQY